MAYVKEHAFVRSLSLKLTSKEKIISKLFYYKQVGIYNDK